MEIIKTDLKGAFIINPTVMEDHRGFFYESYSQRILEENDIYINFVQDNHSYSKKSGTLRGLHFQTNPQSQGKLIRCIRGSIMDVIVDLRIGSPTYKKWISIILSDENKKELFAPRGFAHGFLTLTDNTEVLYKVDNYYSQEHDAGIIWNDPQINIDWNITDVILSEKDTNAPLLSDSKANFRWQD